MKEQVTIVLQIFRTFKTYLPKKAFMFFHKQPHIMGTEVSEKKNKRWNIYSPQIQLQKTTVNAGIECPVPGLTYTGNTKKITCKRVRVGSRWCRKDLHLHVNRAKHGSDYREATRHVTGNHYLAVTRFLPATLNSATCLSHSYCCWTPTD